MPTYAIGDVQGCYTELRALVKAIHFEPSRDQLWFVGDLVNRGPQSLQVLRYVRSLGAAAVVVLGNHDLHLLAVGFGDKDRLRPEDTLVEILRATDCDELLEWLRQQPLLYHDAHLGVTMVHAGLPPQWTLTQARACAKEIETAIRDPHSMQQLFATMYGNQPDLWSEQLRGDDRLRFIVNCFTRLRICDADGRLNLKYKNGFKKIPTGFYPWFQAPARRTEKQRIVCGHWSAIGYCDNNNVLAIDTGCVWGERLCAIRLDKPASPIFVESKQPKRSGD